MARESCDVLDLVGFLQLYLGSAAIGTKLRRAGARVLEI
jgi:hypothetical protein